MAVYHGKNALVYVSTNGTAAAASVGKLTEWTLDMGTETVEVTAFTDANKSYVKGRRDIQGTLSGFFDDSIDTLFSAADSSDGCKVYLYPTNQAVSKYWYGPAWMEVSVQASVADAVKISATFAANGAWGRK